MWRLTGCFHNFPGSFQLVFKHKYIYAAEAGDETAEEVGHVLVVQGRGDALCLECALQDVGFVTVVAGG